MRSLSRSSMRSYLNTALHVVCLHMKRIIVLLWMCGRDFSLKQSVLVSLRGCKLHRIWLSAITLTASSGQMHTSANLKYNVWSLLPDTLLLQGMVRMIGSMHRGRIILVIYVQHIQIGSCDATTILIGVTDMVARELLRVLMTVIRSRLGGRKLRLLSV